MATLSELCTLPEGWGAPSISTQVGMSKKLAWKAEKRAEHDRLKAYREREKRRALRRGSAVSMTSDRQRVRRMTMPDTTSALESGSRMFREGQGERQPKKAKNRASKEQAGTIGRTIVVKRFHNSRLTCVCKSLIV